MKPQEQVIIQKIKEGDESGLRQMFDLYYSPMCVFALKYLDSFDQAEDLVQDIFIVFWENKRVNLLTGSLKSYLFTAVKNNALAHIRKYNKYIQEELGEDVDLFIEEPFDLEDLEEKKNRLYKELGNLSENNRKVFEAIVFENMKYKEVAKEFDVSVNTIKTQFSRSLKQLRGSLDVIIMIMLLNSH